MNNDSKKTKKLPELVYDQKQIRHYSHRTEKSYVHRIKEYIYYFNKKHPAAMGKMRLTSFYPTWRSED
jgi:hypothetical protein